MENAMTIALASSLVTALMGGVFGLLGKWIEHRYLNRTRNALPVSVSEAAPAEAKVIPQPVELRIGAVIRDIGILLILTAVGGFIVGYYSSMSSGEISQEDLYILVAPANILLGTIGFVISGARVRRRKWIHLFAVAIGLWLFGLINVPLLGLTLIDWVTSLLFILLMMLVGGALSYL